jgi:predicted PurR-regulated permease PerM
VLAVLGSVAERVAQRGVAIINLLGLLFITPVVTFYLLARLAQGAGRHRRRAAARQRADHPHRWRTRPTQPVAGYLRGQALVCLCLGPLYSVGLSAVGLQFGFVIGLIAGLISFIPFVGTLVGATLSIGMALAQFRPTGSASSRVAAVFLFGYLLEATCCRPSWSATESASIQSGSCSPCLAGGSLFGFVGVLIAVPVAAIVGVVGASPVGAVPREQLLSRQRFRLIANGQAAHARLGAAAADLWRADFVLSEGNREALAWIDRWPTGRRRRWR